MPRAEHMLLESRGGRRNSPWPTVFSVIVTIHAALPGVDRWCSAGRQSTVPVLGSSQSGNSMSAAADTEELGDPMTHDHPLDSRAGGGGHRRTPTSAFLPMKRIRAVIFDLDGTLAPSKSRVSDSTATGLIRLLGRVDVCIISGGTFEQFDHQVLKYLTGSENLARLHLMPTCGTRYYRWTSGSWMLIYAEVLEPDVRARVIAVLSEGAKSLGLTGGTTWGPTVEDRGTQVT